MRVPVPQVKTLRSTPPLAGGDAVSRMSSPEAAPCCDPRPPRGRRRSVLAFATLLRMVAIHAPLAGGDFTSCDDHPVAVAITPPSREATTTACGSPSPQVLRSTPPSREATPMDRRVSSPMTVRMLRSTPPSREATGSAPEGRHRATPKMVAIHAPLAGGDVIDVLRLL